MVLPATGAIDLGAVNVESGNSFGTFCNIDSLMLDYQNNAEFFYGSATNPDSMSEFYSAQYYPDCFIAGTQITMSGLTTKNIEDVEIGDFVLSYNPYKELFEPKEVLKHLETLHTGEGDDITIIIDFANGAQVQCTSSNPFWSGAAEKYWISYNPPKCQFDHNLVTNQMEIGDTVVTIEGTTTITSITEITEPTTTYSMRVKQWATFVANGLVAHNKCVYSQTNVLLPDHTTKRIFALKAGDSILSWNGSSMEKDTVLEIERVQHPDLITYLFNDFNITATNDHPFLIGDNTYAALRPNDTYGFIPNELRLGDTVKIIKNGILGEERLHGVVLLEGRRFDTYAIKLEKNNCFPGDNVLCYTGINNQR